MSLLLIVLIVLLLVAAGGGVWGTNAYGPYAWSPLAVILVVLALLLLFGRL